MICCLSMYFVFIFDFCHCYLSIVIMLTKLSLINRKKNIFDNMVQMMEKYADNLEELVAEKTVQLMDEKRKTDALLESILPR